MPDVQSASAALEPGAPIEQNQGTFDHIGDEVEYITLTNSGHIMIGTSNNGEWLNIPWEWHYPHVCGNQPEFYRLLGMYQHFWSVSCKFRLFNLQTTGNVGANDFSGAPRNTELLTFTDTWGVTGRGLYQPPLKQKAFNEIYKDGTYITRANDGGASKAFDVFTNETIHDKDYPSDYVPFEGSPNVKVVPTNTSQDIVWTFDMPDGGAPRSTWEFMLQSNDKADDDDINYYRFDNTQHKIFTPNRKYSNMGDVIKNTVDDDNKYHLPITAKTIKFNEQKLGVAQEPVKKEYDFQSSLKLMKWKGYASFFKKVQMDEAPQADGPCQPRIFVKNAYIPGLGNSTMTLRTLCNFKVEYTFKLGCKAPCPINLWNTHDFTKMSRILYQPWSVPQCAMALPWQIKVDSGKNGDDEHWYPNKKDQLKQLAPKTSI